MANEFIARNGIIAKSDSTISGSLIVTTGITGSLEGTASYSATASYVLGGSASSSYAAFASASATSSLPLLGLVTASASNTTITFTKGDGTTFEVTVSQSGSVASSSYSTNALNAQTASYVENAQSASYVLLAKSASYASFASASNTASYAILAQNSNTASYVALAQSASYIDLAQSASYVLLAKSASYAAFASSSATSSYIENAQSASYVALAQSASYVALAKSASYIDLAQSASYVLLAKSASYILNAQSASYASFTSASATASYVENAQSASYVLNAKSASYILNAQSASYTSFASASATASYVALAQSASYVQNAQSASYVLNAISASYALNGGTGGGSTNPTFNRQTGNYTLLITDANNVIEINSAAAATLTIPHSSSVNFETGSQILVTLYSTGSINFATASGVVLRSVGNSYSMSTQYSVATLIKEASNEWYLIGGVDGNVISASYALSASYLAGSISNAVSSSYSSFASASATASYVENAQSASYILNAKSASYASFASASNTASYVALAQSASYVALAQSASYVLLAKSASYAAFASASATASYVQNAVSASYILNAVSASYALNGGSGGGGSSDITFNRQTGNYTLVLTDKDKMIEMNVASAATLTVPHSSSVNFPTGSQILVSLYGTGSFTVITGSGVTIRSVGGSLTVGDQYAGVTLVKDADNEWYLFGGLASTGSSALSASYASTASYVVSSSYALSASYMAGSISNAVSASYALTASYALNGGSGGGTTNPTFNRQTGNYTLVLGDANNVVEMNVASTATLTIPISSSVNFPTGSQILVTLYGAGSLNITASGVNLRSATNSYSMSVQYSAATLVKDADNEWYLFGGLDVNGTTSSSYALSSSYTTTASYALSGGSGGGSSSPGGSEGYVQYKSGSSFGGSDKVIINSSSSLELIDIDNPATPPMGSIGIFGYKVGGKSTLGVMDEFGMDNAIQYHIARNGFSAWIPGGNGTTVTLIRAVALTATGTATAANWAVTNKYTQMRKLEYLVTTPSATAVAGWREAANQYLRGSTAGEGGFQFICSFGVASGSADTNSRLFVGMSNNTSAPTDVNPSTLTNMFGVGYDSADANFQFMCNDGSGTATKTDLGIAIPAADRTYPYRLEMSCAPSGSTIYYKFKSLTQGGTSVTGSVSSNIPSPSSSLSPRGYISAGGSSSAIGIALMSLTMETDF